MKPERMLFVYFLFAVYLSASLCLFLFVFTCLFGCACGGLRAHVINIMCVFVLVLDFACMFECLFAFVLCVCVFTCMCVRSVGRQCFPCQPKANSGHH